MQSLVCLYEQLASTRVTLSLGLLAGRGGPEAPVFLSLACDLALGVWWVLRVCQMDNDESISVLSVLPPAATPLPLF